MFEVIPAVDILDGKCVRLVQGRFDMQTVFNKDPIAAAQKWEEQGAKRLHVVDLDGARTGIPKNFEIVKKIAQTLSIPVQTGGGLRSEKNIKDAIAAGIDRIVLGTTAIVNPNLLGQLCDKYGDRLIISIDAKNNMVVASGWTEVSKKDAISLANEAVGMGVKRFVYTDVSRDGVLAGPNFEGIEFFVSQVSVPVIAAGGISSSEDIQKLKKLRLEGCIIGKALYTGDIKLGEVV
ncbi:MAG: 1-(5-phosphoribosyl)-5-[(5-phosphoribosylamino)methylideneamino]imidazole-4-carboxamide isomerase [Candidatus Margulisiibacteriota bacterium]